MILETCATRGKSRIHVVSEDFNKRSAVFLHSIFVRLRFAECWSLMWMAEILRQLIDSLSYCFRFIHPWVVLDSSDQPYHASINLSLFWVNKLSVSISYHGPISVGLHGLESGSTEQCAQKQVAMTMMKFNYKWQDQKTSNLPSKPPKFWDHGLPRFDWPPFESFNLFGECRDTSGWMALQCPKMEETKQGQGKGFKDAWLSSCLCQSIWFSLELLWCNTAPLR